MLENGSRDAGRRSAVHQGGSPVSSTCRDETVALQGLSWLGDRAGTRLRLQSSGGSTLQILTLQPDPMCWAQPDLLGQPGLLCPMGPGQAQLSGHVAPVAAEGSASWCGGAAGALTQV